MNSFSFRKRLKRKIKYNFSQHWPFQIVEKVTDLKRIIFYILELYFKFGENVCSHDMQNI